jgi:hypothetical protein
MWQRDGQVEWLKRLLENNKSLVEVEVALWHSVSQSVSMSWYRAPLWDLRPDITSCRNVAVWNLLSCFCGTPSLTRGRVFNLQCNHSMVRVARSYFTTDSQSVCLGVQASLRLVTRYYFLSECCCLNFVVLSLWGALSDERTGLQLAVQSLSGASRSEPVTIFYCLIWDCRSQWSSGLGHELFSPAPTLRSWVRIPLRHGCLCVLCVRFFCFYIISSETASRPNKRLMRTYYWISLFMSYKVSKLTYRIWVILIANERVKKSLRVVRGDRKGTP